MSESTSRAAAPDLLADLEAARGDPAKQAQALYYRVRDPASPPPDSTHAPERDGHGHALLASALAYCIGYELHAAGAPVDPTLLRLAALAHDLELPEQARVLLPAPVPRWLANRDLFFDALPGSPFPLYHFTGPAERALYAAHLVASLPLPVLPNRPATQAFREHPLGRGEPLASVALVYGGATRIKRYVFESPRLPEIRGASGLLDRINRVDLRALFGEEFAEPAEAQVAARVRDWFAARAGGTRLEAPECVLYAGGGNLLALAPASLAETVQSAIEAWYAEETLVAQSVAVSRACDLLELQYGLQPTRYWWQEYGAVQADESLRKLLSLEAAASEPDRRELPPGKGFGELTTDLVLGSARRRDERADYPNWETPPYARRCDSCDRRSASAEVSRPSGEGVWLCWPCWRKHDVGRQLKHGRAGSGLLSWIDRFLAYLEHEGAASPYARARPGGDWTGVESPTDLDDIAAAAPRGSLGVIYADGDGMGQQLEEIETAAQYRAFSEQLALATEGAVYAALARHLRPVPRNGRWQHPFEVLSIGGDDVLLLVPGNVALALAASIGRGFEERFPAAGGAADAWAGQRYRPPRDGHGAAVRAPRPTKQSMSGGVVIAPAATPMALLRELAEQLQKSAKRARREARAAEASARGVAESDVPPRGWVDFLVIKGVGLLATSLADWRRRQGRLRRAGEPDGQSAGPAASRDAGPRLGAAPYTWVELEGLLTTARALRDGRFPQTQLYAVRDLLAHGQVAASVDYLYRKTRLERPARALLEAVFERAWASPRADPAQVSGPWRDVERRETILPDLLAVSDCCDAELDSGGDDAPR
ncbi:MAG TPA: hypothetical protein VFE37_12510 [Chloroflexota bacterium]|nr:hypothetical protein [Chloroflexota bacterium]